MPFKKRPGDRASFPIVSIPCAGVNQDDQTSLFGYSQPVLLASAAPNPIMPLRTCALSEPGGGQLIVYTSRPMRNGFAGRAGLEAVVIPNLSFFIDYGIQTNLNNGNIQGLWGGARLWF